MRTLKLFTLTFLLPAIFTACGAPTGNTTSAPSNANSTNANSSKPAAAVPTKEALMAIENAGWEAWKVRDAKWIEENYSDKGFNLGSTGRIDKATMIKMTTTQKCDIKSYSLSDDKLQMAGPDVAILTFRASQDATCDGKKSPAAVWSVSVYVRDGDKWKAAFYSESPVVDPKAPSGHATLAKKDASAPSGDAKPDAATEALMTVETKAWEAWKAKDLNALDAFAGKDLVALSATEGWTDRAASLKRWSDPSCDIKAVKLSDAAGTFWGADYAILTFRSAVEGNCGGQTLPPEWGATIYGKENGTWKAILTLGITAS